MHYRIFWTNIHYAIGSTIFRTSYDLWPSVFGGRYCRCIAWHLVGDRQMTDQPIIRDDGTMDTVVEYRDNWWRYDSEYRYSFKNDDEFLESVKRAIDSELEPEQIHPISPILYAAHNR
tara:strand:- start:388 stop:741 length:354 start_codon:yes stop_codon:yes gene_type:complete